MPGHRGGQVAFEQETKRREASLEARQLDTAPKTSGDRWRSEREGKQEAGACEASKGPHRHFSFDSE